MTDISDSIHEISENKENSVAVVEPLLQYAPVEIAIEMPKTVKLWGSVFMSLSFCWFVMLMAGIYIAGLIKIAFLLNLVALTWMIVMGVRFWRQGAGKLFVTAGVLLFILTTVLPFFMVRSVSTTSPAITGSVRVKMVPAAPPSSPKPAP